MRLNNGFEIPQIGVGTWTLRGETARQNVRLALQAGFRHVDTAQRWCKSNAESSLFAEMQPIFATFCCKYSKKSAIIRKFAL